jgi:hypothetical protein
MVFMSKEVTEELSPLFVYDHLINIVFGWMANPFYLASSMLYPHDWDSVFSMWTLTSDSLASIFIDYDESTIKCFEALVEERPSRALQPLLMEYIFIKQLFVGFHHRQTSEINSMFKFVGLTNAIYGPPCANIVDRNVPPLKATSTKV